MPGFLLHPCPPPPPTLSAALLAHPRSLPPSRCLPPRRSFQPPRWPSWRDRPWLCAIALDGSGCRRNPLAPRAGAWLLGSGAAIGGWFGNGCNVRVADQSSVNAQQSKSLANTISLVSDGGQVAQRTRISGAASGNQRTHKKERRGLRCMPLLGGLRGLPITPAFLVPPIPRRFVPVALC